MRYPYADGFIHPWTDGRLRDGLTFHGQATGTCEPASETTATAGRCFAANYIYDPCFSQRSKWRPGAIAACPKAAGSTTFLRFRIQKPPNP
jgi:hypothetical protein